MTQYHCSLTTYLLVNNLVYPAYFPGLSIPPICRLLIDSEVDKYFNLDAHFYLISMDVGKKKLPDY